MTEKVETRTIKGLRYVVAVLKEDDLAYMAKLIAKEIRAEDDRQTQMELDLEHRRQVPTQAILETVGAEEGSPWPIELVNGEWKVRDPG